MKRFLLLVLAGSWALAQTPVVREGVAPATPAIAARGATAPSSGSCDASGELGSIYLRSDNPATNPSIAYRCIQTGASTFAWVPFTLTVNTTLPATCDVGQLSFKSDATAGQNLYGCVASNTWQVLGDGGGAGSGITSLDGQTGGTQTITRGIGIIGSSAGNDHAFALDLAELVNNQTLWDSSQATRTLTAGLSGANDPVITFGNNTVNISTGILQQGGVAVVLQSLTLTGGVGIAALGDLSTNRTITFDSTEVGNTTWSDGASATITHTYSVTGTDPSWAYSASSIVANSPVTAPGFIATGSGKGIAFGEDGTALTPTAGEEVVITAPTDVTTAYTIELAAAPGNTGVVKATVSGATVTLSHAALVSGDIPNNAANTTGSAATLTTPRTIGGTSFDGSANIVPSLIAIVDTTDTTASCLFVDSATGDLQPKTDGGCTYNASTGMLTATGFTGPLTGTASLAVTLTDADKGDVTVSGGLFTIDPGTVTRDKVTAILRTRIAHFKVWGTGGSNVLQDTDDELSILNNQLGSGITITKVTCESDTGTPSIQLQRDDGSPANILSSSLSCATTPASTTTFSGTENQIADAQRVDFLVDTAGGSAHWVAVTVTYTVD